MTEAEFGVLTRQYEESIAPPEPELPPEPEPLPDEAEPPEPPPEEDE